MENSSLEASISVYTAREGGTMEGHADRNGGPWIVEDIAKGPCMYAFVSSSATCWCRYRLIAFIT